jgi:hypothetical protein
MDAAPERFSPPRPQALQAREKIMTSEAWDDSIRASAASKRIHGFNGQTVDFSQPATGIEIEGIFVRLLLKPGQCPASVP